MLTPDRAILPVVVASLLTGVPAARGQFTAQQTTVAISFADSQFGSTAFTATNRLTWQSRFAGDSAPLIWVTGNTGAIISRTAAAVQNCSIQGFTAPPVSSQAGYTLVAAAGGATLHDFILVSRPDNERVTLAELNGFAALSFNSTSSPIATVSSASYRVVLPGDWSSRGTGMGQLEMLGLNPGWAVDQDWVFNGTGTEFAATRTSGSSGVGLRFVLHGAEIPAPGGIVLAGLALAGMSARRRRV